MPARVHALLVVRSDERTLAAFHLQRTLLALKGQTRPVDRLTVVVCGSNPEIMRTLTDATVDDVVSAPPATGYADALSRVEVADADAVWLLAQDTAPDSETLARLVAALEISPSVAIAAPKLVRWDDRTAIVSLGLGVTTFGRTVEYAAGEFDQGQHDGREDVMGADVRGILVRAAIWNELHGLDRGLHGADEGLDLAVRARLAGHRVALAPRAFVATAGDGVAGMPSQISAERRMRIVFAERVAALHRRMVYAPVFAVVLHWLSILPLALWRTATQLLRKQPERIGPEWAAAVVALVQPVAVARARRGIRRTRTIPWSRLSPLRVTAAQLRARLHDDANALIERKRTDLRFFRGGGAWLVLAALVASIVFFSALLAWPVLGGGALQPLRLTVAGLWSDATLGLRATTLDTVAPADPFAALVAVLGSLTPWAPSQALVVLWLLALPLAALGGWMAATRITERSGLRLLSGLVWALAPTFVVALSQGRPTAVIVHLLLPWLFFAGSVAHRSWSAAGAASLLLAAVIAAAPVLAPALLVVWLGVLVLVIFVRSGRGLGRVLWALVPTAVMFAPLGWQALREGSGWALLSDPGVPWAGPQVGADPAGRLLLAAGIPTSDLAGWQTFLPDSPLWWVPLLVAPLALLALPAPLTRRWAAGIVLVVLTVLGIGTAFVGVGISVAYTQSTVVPLWPGTGVSLAWLGALGAALVTLDAGAIGGRVVRVLGGVVVAAAVVTLALPSLTAMPRGTALLQDGPASTLPAFVAAESARAKDLGTIVLTPQNSLGLSATVVWGSSETLGGASTTIATRLEPTDGDRTVADIAADLVATTTGDAVQRLAAEGIGFVLLAPAVEPESDAARALRLSATTVLSQRADLDHAGDTAKGILWRVTDDVAPRQEVTASEASLSGFIAVLQFITVAAGLLLAIPTTVTLREARRTPRIVGWHRGGA